MAGGTSSRVRASNTCSGVVAGKTPLADAQDAKPAWDVKMTSRRLMWYSQLFSERVVAGDTVLAMGAYARTDVDGMSGVSALLVWPRNHPSLLDFTVKIVKIGIFKPCCTAGHQASSCRKRRHSASSAAKR